MTEPVWLGWLALGSGVVGAFVHRLRVEHEAAHDSICPVCYGPTDDDGTSEAWGDAE